MANQRLLCCILVSSLAVLLFAVSAEADDSGKEVILPAGTLIRCTLSEPNFSTKTAEVGDPVICHLNQLRLFDRDIFPRGAYLGGHLEAAKEPGHFVGKGYLQLEFDKIGLPEGQIPVPAKVISAKGYRVDRQGKVVGHGHPVRDAAEWMFPPLWPEKVVTLPARGPRPTLKGEEVLTLRLMDDVAVPAEPILAWHYFRRSGTSSFNQVYRSPSQYIPGQAPARTPQSRGNVQVAAADTHAPSSSPVNATGNAPVLPNDTTVGGLQETALGKTTKADSPARTAAENVLVLRDGSSHVVTALHMDGSQLRYSRADGTTETVRLDEVDWTRTFRKNAENGMPFTLTGENLLP